MESSIVIDSSIGSVSFFDIISMTVTVSPFTPSTKLINTLIEIASSTVTESSMVLLPVSPTDIMSSIVTESSMVTNRSPVLVIESFIVTSSSKR